MKYIPSILVLLVLFALIGPGGCAEGTTDEVNPTSTSGTGGTSDTGGGGTGGEECTTEICDGLDNDCDDLVDEDCACQNGATQACYTGPADTQGVGVCTVGTQLCEDNAWGDCEGEVTPGDEVCDGLDNDCDELIDTDDEAPEDLCPPVENGTPACDPTLSVCLLGSCDPTHADVNQQFSDGCECEVEPSPITAGSTCQTAVDLGTLYDVNADVLWVTGNTATTGREIWWTFEADDDTDTAGDEFHVDVRFLDNPSGHYEMDVYRGGCDAGFRLAEGEVDSFDWYVDFPRTSTGCTGTSPCGEGDCVPSPGSVGHNSCSDDTSVFFVVVRRIDTEPSCELFQLEISNGQY